MVQGAWEGPERDSPMLRSDLPMGNVTFELELEGHRHSRNEQCGQRGENEWRVGC